MSDPTPQMDVLRTVPVGVPAPLALRGLNSQIVAQTWGSKRVAETAWFAVDFAADLDPADAVIAAAVTVSPDIPGGLSVLRRTAAGTLVSAMLSGGVAGTTYAVTMSAATANQSLHPATVQLQVTA